MWHVACVLICMYRTQRVLYHVRSTTYSYEHIYGATRCNTLLNIYIFSGTRAILITTTESTHTGGATFRVSPRMTIQNVQIVKNCQKLTTPVQVYKHSTETYFLSSTPSVPLIWSQSILLKTRFEMSFGFFFVGLGMFVRGGNASVVAVNIT